MLHHADSSKRDWNTFYGDVEEELSLGCLLRKEKKYYYNNYKLTLMLR